MRVSGEFGFVGSESRLHRVVFEFPGFFELDFGLLFLVEQALDYYWRLRCHYKLG